MWKHLNICKNAPIFEHFRNVSFLLPLKQDFTCFFLLSCCHFCILLFQYLCINASSVYCRAVCTGTMIAGGQQWHSRFLAAAGDVKPYLELWSSSNYCWAVMRQVASRVCNLQFYANTAIWSTLVQNLQSCGCACHILLSLLCWRWEHQASGMSRMCVLAREEWNSLDRKGARTELFKLWFFAITLQTRQKTTSGCWHLDRLLYPNLLGSSAFISDLISWISPVRHYLKWLACKSAYVKRCN